ncbi:Two-component system histidine kinase DccS [hydrothermal vent metagenome]|uniref:histidine kinase n=1 Tax=hydrothermal vent metagenome TaxID=652676 RepID=A0A1W1CFA6_9ZZZZ
MSVSKNKATNLLRSSEKSSLRRFLALYFILVVMILSLLGTFYYQSKEKLMHSNQRTTLSNYAHEQIQQLRRLHRDFPKKTTYPRSSEFDSAIYDIERSKIFSTLKNDVINFDKEIYRKDGKVRFMTYLDDYYLGAKYLFIEIDEDKEWHNRVMMEIFTLGTVILIVFAIFGIFFVNLFLRPMKNSIMLLDNFIKDTTHELNTPISAILANVEMMDLDVMEEKNRKKLARINIAAKTVSHLYQDLTYLTLNHNRKSNDEWIDLKKLVEDRVDYFAILASSKKVTFDLDLNYSTIFIDGVKIARVIDNLISNAIKYNKRGGKITITLRKDYFIIKDSGIGIESEKVNEIFERYTRFNSSEGGFGIGLNIVKSIIEEYSLKISVSSVLNKGTTIRIDFLKGTVNDK